MAYVERKEDDEEVGTQGQPAMTGAGAPTQTTSGGATGGGQTPSKSGSWVNLNQYLQNKPQIEQTAQKLVGEPQQKTELAKQAITQTQAEYQKQLPTGVSAQQKEMLSNALLGKADIKKAQETFQQLSKPINVGKVDISKYTPAYEEAKKTNLSKQKDVGEQLQDVYGTAQSVGKQALDVFALRNDPTARGLLEQAKQTAIQRQAALDKLVGRNTALESEGQMTAKQIQDYVKTMQQKASEKYKTSEKDIQRRYEQLRVPYEQSLQIQNLIQNNQDISKAQAKQLGIDYDLYSATLADRRRQMDRYQNTPGYADPNQVKMAELNTAIAQVNRAYNVDDFIKKHTEAGMFDLLQNPSSPSSNKYYSDFAKMNNISVEEAKKTLPALLRMGGQSAGFARDPSRLPSIDTPDYADYMSVNELPKSATDIMSQQEAARLNQLNSIFGLGQKDVVGGSGVGTNYGPTINQQQYFSDLFNYIQGVLATPKKSK